jgi:integrase
VLKALQIGSTFVKEDEQFFIRMPAEKSKTSKPTVIPLPFRLTPFYDYYLAVVRPMLRERGGARNNNNNNNDEDDDDQYLFLKENGTGPRPEFSAWTRQVTMDIVGKSYNAHSFRHAVITSLYQAGSTQAEMDQLATLMQHDVSVAREVYFRPQLMQAANAAASKLDQLMME